MGVVLVDRDEIRAFLSEIRARPGDDVFAEVRGRLEARGLGHHDSLALAWVLDHLIVQGGARVDDGTPTSLGRWLIAQASPDPRVVLSACAKRGDDEVLVLVQLLVHAAPAVYFAYEPALLAALTKDGSRVVVCKALLAAGQAAHARPMIDELLAMARTDQRAFGLHPWFAVHAAGVLEHYPQFRAHAFGFAEAALVHGEEADFQVRLAAVELLVRVFGEAAIPALAHYHEPGDTSRLDGYRAIAKHLGAKGRDLLVDALVRPPEPDPARRAMPRPRYIAKLLEIMRPLDLAPHAARIRKALKGKQLAPLVEAALTGKVPAVKLPPPRKVTRGYAFDELAAAIVHHAVAAIVAHRPAKPIRRVKLVLQEEGYAIEGLVIDDHELELPAVPSRLPASSDDLDDDRLLPALIKRYRLDDGEGMPAWGDVYALPECLWYRELILAARRVLAALPGKRIAVARGAQAVVGHHDDDWSDIDELERHAREGMQALPYPQLREEFAATCYAKPAARRWLVS